MMISGFPGQDAFYLAQIALNQGISVIALCHPEITEENRRVICSELEENKSFELLKHDICDADHFSKLLHKFQPTEFYNLAGLSRAGGSFDQPAEYIRVNSGAVAQMIERLKDFPDIHFIQASSGEIFSSEQKMPLNENSKIGPRNPYGWSKAAAFGLVQSFRRDSQMKLSNLILFNHESPRRPEFFVTRKIIQAACRISKGSGEALELGNINIWRDWGHAEDYMLAASLVGASAHADDYVIASGEPHSLEEFLAEAFGRLGLNWKDHVTSSDKFKRTSDPEKIYGDPSKIRTRLGWKMRHSFSDLIQEMLDSDLALLEQQDLTNHKESKVQ